MSINSLSRFFRVKNLKADGFSTFNDVRVNGTLSVNQDIFLDSLDINNAEVGGYLLAIDSTMESVTSNAQVQLGTVNCPFYEASSMSTQNIVTQDLIGTTANASNQLNADNMGITGINAQSLNIEELRVSAYPLYGNDVDYVLYDLRERTNGELIGTGNMYFLYKKLSASRMKVCMCAEKLSIVADPGNLGSNICDIEFNYTTQPRYSPAASISTITTALDISSDSVSQAYFKANSDGTMTLNTPSFTLQNQDTVDGYYLDYITSPL